MYTVYHGAGAPCFLCVFVRRFLRRRGGGRVVSVASVRRFPRRRRGGRVVSVASWRLASVGCLGRWARRGQAGW